LPLRKILKTVATRCHLLKLKCTKFNYGWGSAADPAGGAYSRWCRLSSSRGWTIAYLLTYSAPRPQFDTRRRFIISPVTTESEMNAVARRIFSSSRFQHITPLLRQLHWLKAPERIAFKQSVLVYKSVYTDPHLHTLLTSFFSGGRCRGSSATPFQFIFIIECQPHPTPYCR